MALILLIYLMCTLFCVQADEVTIVDSSNNAFTEGEEKQFVLNFDNATLYQTCTAWCEVNHVNYTMESCNNRRDVIHVKLNTIKLSQAHIGRWICTVEENSLERHFTVTVTRSSAETTSESLLDPRTGAVPLQDHKWWYIWGSLGVIVSAIIIAQTVCVLYFRSKARLAEINKNLTPKNDNTQMLAARYEVRPKSKKNSIDEIRESVVYEALDTIKERVPPPPPIETLPGALTRFNSESCLSKRPDVRQTQTTPRPQAKLPSNKFNTVDGNSSLKRILNRPRLPLPNPEEEYEIMERDGHSVPKGIYNTNVFMPQRDSKSKRFFGETPPLERRAMDTKLRLHGQDLNNSPMMIRKQTSNFVLAGQNTTFTGQNKRQRGPPTMPKTAFSGQNERGLRAQIPGPNTQFERQNMFIENANESRIFTGQNRPHAGQNEPFSGTNWRAQRQNLEAVPVLPHMVSPESLKPVKHFMKPPAESEDTSRISPAESFTNLASRRPPPVPNKPKPPMPIPIPVQAIGPSDDDTYDPRATWGDEWTYEALPAYNIYGNAPPSKRND